MLEDQVRRAFENLNAVLGAAGCTFDDVVDVTVFLVDPEAIFERVWVGLLGIGAGAMLLMLVLILMWRP
ncbi:RutC family protein YjgH [compost metagenome]